MSKVLTQKEVERLYKLCIEKKVNEYDLQIEVVDHIASDIEQQWEKDQELSFDDALENSVSKFDKDGLYWFAQKIKKELIQRLNRMAFDCFIDYIKIPKIIMTVALFLAIFTCFRLCSNDFLPIMGISVCASLFGLRCHFFFYPKKIDITISDNKNLVLLDYLKKIKLQIWGCVLMPVYMLIAETDFYLKYDTVAQELFFSLMFVVVIIVLYVHSMLLPQKIREYFFKNYAELTC